MFQCAGEQDDEALNDDDHVARDIRHLERDFRAALIERAEEDCRDDDAGWVANRWCELLPVPMELKQRLMELDNPLVRLELVGDVLERTGIAQ